MNGVSHCVPIGVTTSREVPTWGVVIRFPGTSQVEWRMPIAMFGSGCSLLLLLLLLLR